MSSKGQKQPSETQSLPDLASGIPPDWEDQRKESLYADLWDQMCSIIQGKIQSQSFTMWIQPCYISSVSEGTATLATPNGFIAEWVEEHYLWLVQWTIKEVDENIQEVTVMSSTF